MISTLETLKEALEKYNLALDTFEKLTSTIRTQNRKLEKLTDKNSAEHKELRTKMRAGLWSSVGVTTVGLIFADIFGCLGICSATGVAVSVTAIAGAEGGFAKYTAKLETWKGITDRMVESGFNFDRTLIEAIGVPTDEIDLINNWTNSAEVVNSNIEKYPQQYLKKYKTIRTVFGNGLDDLSNSAQDFLDQPVDILGQTKSCLQNIQYY